MCVHYAYIHIHIWTHIHRVSIMNPSSSILHYPLHARAKADHRVLDDKGRSPLFHAAFSGSVRCVAELVSHGADVDLADKYGVSPLRRAAMEGTRSQLF